MPRVCQREGCGHRTTNKNQRFCPCKGCECLKFDKAERMRLDRAKNNAKWYWVELNGRYIGLVAKKSIHAFGLSGARAVKYPDVLKRLRKAKLVRYAGNLKRPTKKSADPVRRVRAAGAGGRV